ncbi:MAG: DUF2357 domain-containing protein [Armatimonadota bacterium]
MIFLHSITFSWPGGRKLLIQTTDGEPTKPCVTPLADNKYIEEIVPIAVPDLVRTPSLCYAPDPEGFYSSIRLRENTRYMLAVTVPTTRVEAERLLKNDSANRLTWPFVDTRLKTVVNFISSRFWQETIIDGVTFTTLVGYLNFLSFIGTANISLDSEKPLIIEIASEKIDYYNDFKDLLAEIADNILDLLFEVDSVAGLSFPLNEPEVTSTAVTLFHLRRLMSPDKLPLAIETIIRNPNTRLIESTRYTPPAKIRNPIPEQVAQLGEQLNFVESGPLEELFRGHTPIRLPESIKYDTVDTPENRFVKAFLLDLSEMLYRLEIDLLKYNKKHSLLEVKNWKIIVDNWLDNQLWNDVGQLTHIPSNSQVLQKRVGYRDVLEIRGILDCGLRLPWDEGRMIAEDICNIRPLYTLYEYWCFFVLREALRTVCGQEQCKLNSFYINVEGKLAINLKQGITSALDYTYIENGKTASIKLFYKRRFRKIGDDDAEDSYSVTFDPDFSILVTVDNKRWWLHFDAKYRLDTLEWKSEVAEDSPSDEYNLERISDNRSDVYLKEDLYKMHTYHDAILGSLGAYIIYPGNGVEYDIFIRNRSHYYRNNHKIPSIGAFPLRPHLKDAQIVSIVSFLKDSFNEILL